MKIGQCDCCKFDVGEKNLLKVRNGMDEYFFCDFCRETFVGNSMLYPSVKMEDRNILQTIAYSHNQIMKKLKEINGKLKESANICRKSSTSD